MSENYTGSGWIFLSMHTATRIRGGVGSRLWKIHGECVRDRLNKEQVVVQGEECTQQGEWKMAEQKP